MKTKKYGIIISRDFPPVRGGISRYTFELYRRLKNYFKIKIVTLDKTNNDKNLIKISRTGSFAFDSILFVPKATFYAIRSNADFVFATTYFHSLPGVIVKLVTGTPLITAVHDLGIIDPHVNVKSNYFVKLVKWLIHFLSIKLSDVVITPSPLIYKKVYSLFGSKDKLKIIPYGVDFDIFNENVDSGVIRKLYNIKPDTKIILFVGGFFPKKGLEYIIGACGILKNDFKFKDFKLILNGSSIDINYDRLLQDLIVKYELENHVLFVNSTSDKDLSHFYKDCDMFVIASYYGEGLGLPCIEAAAMGKPVIATELFEENKALVNNETGLVVKIKNSKEIAENMFKLIKDRNLAKTLGKNGIKYSKRFNWDSYANELRDIISSLG